MRFSKELRRLLIGGLLVLTAASLSACGASNGCQVGYSEDSFDAADFDITPYLNKDGKDNLLAVKVYRWCDGSYFENQDFLRLAGIFRDVYLYSTTGVRISDYTVVTDLDDDFVDAELRLDVKLDNTIFSASTPTRWETRQETSMNTGRL